MWTSIFRSLIEKTKKESGWQLEEGSRVEKNFFFPKTKDTRACVD